MRMYNYKGFIELLENITTDIITYEINTIEYENITLQYFNEHTDGKYKVISFYNINGVGMLDIPFRIYRNKWKLYKKHLLLNNNETFGLYGNVLINAINNL